MERYLTLSGIHDFVQQVARYDSMRMDPNSLSDEQKKSSLYNEQG